MPILIIYSVVFLLFSIALPTKYVGAVDISDLAHEKQEEPLLTEVLTVVRMDFSAPSGGYRITAIEKAAFLITNSIHLKCFEHSIKNRLQVEVVFTAYSLKVKQCRLRPDA